MKVNIAVQIKNEAGDTATISLTEQPSVAQAIGFALRALQDDILRMDQCLAEVIELVDEQIEASYHNYSFFADHTKLREQLLKAAEGLRDGWEEHDAQMRATLNGDKP